MEAIVSRAAGIDIGKAVLKAAVRVQGEHGEKTRRAVRTFAPPLRSYWRCATGSLLRASRWWGWSRRVCFGSRSTTCSKMLSSAGC